MQKVISDIALCAIKKRVVPLILGPNTIEVRSLVKRIAAEVQPPGRLTGIQQDKIIFARDENDMLMELLLEEEARGVAFLKGDQIPGDVQEAFVRQKFVRFDLSVAIVTADAPDLVQRGLWDESFYRVCTKTFCMPTWNEREADQDEILDQIERRLPNETKLHSSAVKVLKAMTYKGIDDVKRAIDRGYGTLLRDKRPDGPMPTEITGDHLIGNDIRALSSQRIRLSDKHSEPPMPE